MKYCRQCGSPAPDDSRFCENCGTRFSSFVSVSSEEPRSDSASSEKEAEEQAQAPKETNGAVEINSSESNKKKKLDSLEEIYSLGYFSETEYKARKRDLLREQTPAAPIQQSVTTAEKTRNTESEKDKTISKRSGCLVRIVMIIVFLILLRACFGGESSNSSRPSEHYITNQEAFYAAQEIVKENLKSPSTAKFCSYSEAKILYLGNGQYQVSGWVDAQNSFGAMLRKNFVATFTEMKDAKGEVGFKGGKVVFND